MYRPAKFLQALLPVLLLPLSMEATGQALEPIGSVTLLLSSAEASDATGTARELAVGSEIHSGDTLRTNRGVLMLRMRDQAVLSLRPGTELTFERYDRDAEPVSTGTAVVQMAQGALRLISVSMDEQDQGVYRIVTPLAVVESGRADQEVVLTREALFNSVNYGSTSISNESGSIRLGQGADHDFSETLPWQAPAGLLAWPLGL